MLQKKTWFEWENAKTRTEEGKTRFHVVTEGNGDTWVKGLKRVKDKLEKRASNRLVHETVEEIPA